MALALGTKLDPYEIVARSAPAAWTKSTVRGIGSRSHLVQGERTKRTVLRDGSV
jgi:hypothetical protein